MLISKRSGFTLIEMSVVITVLAVMAALMMPNLAKRHESEVHRAFPTTLRGMFIQARERAISSGKTQILSFNDSANEFVISEDTSQQQSSTTEAAPDLSITVPDGMAPSVFELNGNSTSSSEWQVHFYADGYSDRAGVQIDDGELNYSITQSDRGVTAIYKNTLEEVPDEHWEAGDYEHRTS